MSRFVMIIIISFLLAFPIRWLWDWESFVRTFGFHPWSQEARAGVRNWVAQKVTEEAKARQSREDPEWIAIIQDTRQWAIRLAENFRIRV